jgi:hypothetical protein
MKYGQKLKLGDAHVTPRNIQEVQVSKLGDAPRHPFFIGKNQVIFQDTVFLLLRILCDKGIDNRARYLSTHEAC